MENKIYLTKQEIEKCWKLFEKLCSQDKQMEQELEARFDNAKEIRNQIEQGVDEFYQLYQENITGEVILEKLDEAMANMDSLKQYKYLSNLMVAITHIGGNIFEGPVWNESLKDHQTVLSALELGLINCESEKVLQGIEEMKATISENIDAFAVLFVDNPEFEKIQEACMTENPQEVQALAINTREAAVNMAAAIYILQEDKELKSLSNTHYTPRDIGVMSATMLEIDAAKKSGSLEFVKSICAKAARIAVTLLIASPVILTGLALFKVVAFFTEMATVGMIICGAILGINLHMYVEHLKNHLEPAFKVGEKVLNITLDKVRTIYSKVSGWVQNTIAPKALPVWQKCRDYTMKNILIPAAAFLLKIKDKVLNATDSLAEKAQKIAENLSIKVQDLFKAAENVKENEKNSGAQENEPFHTALPDIEDEEKESPLVQTAGNIDNLIDDDTVMA